MNATSLYVSTCRLVLQANAEEIVSWTDLFRLMPYLRQSLSCTVCGNLLTEPYTPTETNCQHHVCKSCKGGKKKLKPSCSWCKDYDKYVENVQLRILLQCYKKLCEYLTSTYIFKKLANSNLPPCNMNANLLDGTTPSLTSLIQEGAGFADEFRTSASARSNSFLLPCIMTNSISTQTYLGSSVQSPEDGKISPTNGERLSPEMETTENIEQNGSLMYSVLYAGSGNKLTIKRKSSEPNITSIKNDIASSAGTNVPTFKTAGDGPAIKKRGGGGGPQQRVGCRCGNATATPGKLTCCGQRCACYTDSKACANCKCRGCRNPHMADGLKVLAVQLPDSGDCGGGPVIANVGGPPLATTGPAPVQVVGMGMYPTGALLKVDTNDPL